MLKIGDHINFVITSPWIKCIPSAPSIDSFDKIGGTCYEVGTNFEVCMQFVAGTSFKVGTIYKVGTIFEDICMAEFGHHHQLIIRFHRTGGPTDPHSVR